MITLSQYMLNPEDEKKVRSFIEKLQNKEAMPFRECPLYERCNAPLCPMDPNIGMRIWHSDEDVCSSSDYKDNQAVITQKKIAKKGAEGYFTYGMLNRDIIVKKGIQGVDPDIPRQVERKGQDLIDALYQEREDAWIKIHPEISKEQRQRMKDEGMKRSESLKRYREMI